LLGYPKVLLRFQLSINKRVEYLLYISDKLSVIITIFTLLSCNTNTTKYYHTDSFAANSVTVDTSAVKDCIDTSAAPTETKRTISPFCI
jgi:hypothetical protein